MPLKVEKLAGGFSTNYEYRITGTQEEVSEWVVNFFQNYPPGGYGSMARKTQDNPDGTVTYRAFRFYSCD